MIIVPFPEMVPLAKGLAQELGAEMRPLDWHHFPDGESLVTLPPELGDADVAIVATMRDPDRLALPLRFAATTARELGAARVGLVAPYLGYMRQDHRFAGGQAVSAPLFARFLGETFDWLVTVDPHLHRIARLEDVFSIPAICATTAPLIADWIRKNMPDAIVLGPDSESQQWVAEVARLAERPYEVLEKTRSGDRDVEVSVPKGAMLRQGTPVILDDIASSGRTMVRVIEQLLTAGASEPVCLVIHAVFAGNAYNEIMAAGAKQIATTDTIPHVTNAITTACPLAAAIERYAFDLPVDEKNLRF